MGHITTLTGILATFTLFVWNNWFLWLAICGWVKSQNIWFQYISILEGKTLQLSSINHATLGYSTKVLVHWSITISHPDAPWRRGHVGSGSAGISQRVAVEEWGAGTVLHGGRLGNQQNDDSTSKNGALNIKKYDLTTPTYCDLPSGKLT